MSSLIKDLRKRTRVVSFRPWPEDVERWNAIKIPMGEKTRALRSAFRSMLEMFEEEKGVKIVRVKSFGEVAEQGVAGGGGGGSVIRITDPTWGSAWRGGSGATPTLRGEVWTDAELDLEERTHRPGERVLDERDPNEAAG